MTLLKKIIAIWAPGKACPHQAIANGIIKLHFPDVELCIFPQKATLLINLVLITESLVAIHYNHSMTLILFFIYFYFLAQLTLIDFTYLLLPDILTLPLLWIGLIVNSHTYFVTPSQAIMGAVSGYMSLYLFLMVFFLLRGQQGLGRGDCKLFSAAGALLGYKILPVLLSGSCLITLSYVLFQKSNNKKLDQYIPFGPGLCIGIGLMIILKLKQLTLLH